MGDVIKGIGKVAGTAAPFAGLIPGVGPLAAAAIGAGGRLLGGGGVQGAIEGGAEGGLGGLAQKLGALNTEGHFDPVKALGLGGNMMSMIGAGQQRKSAQDYANAGVTQRNQLMSQILGPQNYGIPKSPNLNQQSSATPGIGSGGSAGY